jgi:ribosomal protein S18 acetylase RimI-like enzyme
MPDLFAEPFSPEKRSAVQGFSCGSEPWEHALNEWIKGNRAEESMKRGTLVRLYRLHSGELVGFGSIGKCERSWPNNRDERQELSIIPALAIATAFQGKPDGAPFEQRYAFQIMSDLVAVAMTHGTRILILEVDQRNERAVKFYRRWGFQDAGTRDIPGIGVQKKMLVVLH